MQNVYQLAYKSTDFSASCNGRCAGATHPGLMLMEVPQKVKRHPLPLSSF